MTEPRRLAPRQLGRKLLLRSLQFGPGHRIAVATGAICVVFAALVVRVAYLSVIDGARLAEIARRQHSDSVRVIASRGAILDRNGEILAETVAVPSVFASPRYHAVEGEAREKLRSSLRLTKATTDRRLDSNAGFVWVKRRATWEDAAAVDRLNLPGVSYLVEGRRAYPHGMLAAHVIGAAGTDLRGLEGVERYYDRFLRGKEHIFRVVRDGRGRSLFTEGLDPEVGAGETDAITLGPEATLVLTIDSKLQAISERALADGVREARADAGTAIVMDPHTGAILAMANVPTFDPSNPGAAPAAARRNRAVTDNFEPGSTFKAVVAAAAVQEAAVRPDEKINCERGHYQVGRRTIHDHHPYGDLTLPEIIQHSSNICATKVAQRLGRDLYGSYVTRLGFGQRTAIDLPAEALGIVRPIKSWKPIDLATVSFGQGISVTPIQLATAYAALGNGGMLVRPHVLERAIDPAGNLLFERAEYDGDGRGSAVVNTSTAQSVTSMLERVVEVDGGTGAKARVAGVRVAGKTGTAQKVDPVTGRYSSQRLASFVGFAPAEDPMLVILVMIDNPRTASFGGIVAAPVYAEIMAAALDLQGRRPPLSKVIPAVLRSHGAPPTRLSGVQTISTGAPLTVRGGKQTAKVAPASAATAPPADGMPSLIGMSLRRALQAAGRAGLTVDVHGSGYVVQQNPPPGGPRGTGTVEIVLEATA